MAWGELLLNEVALVMFLKSYYDSYKQLNDVISYEMLFYKI